MTKLKPMRIICPNGHLGFAPTKEASFQLGVETRPDFYCCDSGSDDIGPVPLGTDTSASPREWQIPPYSICTWPYEAMYSDDVLNQTRNGPKYDPVKRRAKAKEFFESVNRHRNSRR